MLYLFSVLRVVMSDTQGLLCLVCSIHCVPQPHTAAAGLASFQDENKRLTFVEGKIHVVKIEVCECLSGCHFFQCIGELFCSLNTRETKEFHETSALTFMGQFRQRKKLIFHTPLHFPISKPSAENSSAH